MNRVEASPTKPQANATVLLIQTTGSLLRDSAPKRLRRSLSHTHEMREYSHNGTTMLPSYRKTSTASTNTTASSSAGVTPGDALAVRREGAESVIAKLRSQLTENETVASTKEAAIAKQEAVILELRSQLRLSQQEKEQLEEQLQRSTTQLSTADMVRKELEDTLEAEQYTWELRVQELERELQQHSQRPVEMEKLQRERAELQGCLDEALKELEAVDAELQNNHDLESIRTLYSWIVRNDEDENLPAYQTVPEWVHAIRSLLSQKLEEHERLKKMETQMSSIQEELEAQTDGAAELRRSLKEAVDLLKPLQESVAQVEREKAKVSSQLLTSQRDATTFQQQVRDLKERLHMSEDESDQLRQKAESLEIELSKAKLDVASSVVSNHSLSVDESSVQKTRDELRTKRKTEKTLKLLLRDAQSKFSTLQQKNEQVVARNSELERKVNDSADSGNDSMLRSYEAHIEQLEAEIHRLRSNSSTNELEQELERKNHALVSKKQSEATLQRSLKEALGLIKPLQSHLEESEQEKAALLEELKVLRSSNGLHDVVQQLELENSQLQDALEEMSQTVASDRLAQELVELQSRYEVTQQRLEAELKKDRGKNSVEMPFPTR